MRTRVIVAASALLIAGCQGVQEIREAEPLQERVAEADWRDLLACFTEKHQEHNLLVQTVVREREQRARLLALLGGMTPAPMWEITFAAQGPGRTVLQHRTTLRTIWGHYYGLSDFARWSEECAAEEPARP